MDVTLITREDCAACEQAKQLLDRLAREYPLAVSTLDVDSPAGQAIAVRGGLLFPPGIFLDGDAFGDGRPSEQKLRREIERRLGPVICYPEPPGALAKLRRAIGRGLRSTRTM